MSSADSNPANASNGSRFRRRQYLVNPIFQWKQAATTALGVFLITMIISTVVCYVFHQQARLRVINPGADGGAATTTILVASLGFALVTAAGVGVWSIYSSHRICGPLHLITRYCQEIRDGRFPDDLRPLRKKDEFKEFYAAFAETVHVLRVHKQQQIAELTDAIETATAARILEGDAVATAMDSLTARLDRLRREAAGTLGNKDLFTAEPTASEPEAPSPELATQSA